jgi:hypothetical protein
MIRSMDYGAAMALFSLSGFAQGAPCSGVIAALANGDIHYANDIIATTSRRH